MLDNNKKKIIYLISSIHPSGPTTVLYNLINNLDKNIYDVFLFILSKKVNSTDNMFKEIVNQIYYFPINKLYHLKKRLRTISPDIVHSQSLRADIIHSLVANKAHTSFSTIHSYYPLDYSLNLFGKTIGSLISYIHIKSLRKIKYFKELKERKVINTAGIYAVSSFIIMQVAALIQPALMLPEWTSRLIFILLVLGFP